QMEEKVVGGKEKKYVLYTVVGEERGKAGLGVWVVRVLLGALMLVALAVVPYLSLRLAQVSDRTLVVFQPVPIRNHSLHHHNHDHHVIEHGKLGHVDVISILQSASLTRENYTELNETTKNNSSSNTSSNSSSNGVVTLHEAAVTLAVMEDTNSTRKATDENGTESVTSGDIAVPKTEDEEEKDEDRVTTEQAEGTSESPNNVANNVAELVNSSNSAAPISASSTSIPNTTITPQHSNEASSAPDAATQAIIPSSQKTPTDQNANLTTKTPIAKVLAVSTTLAPAPSTTTSTTTTTTTTTSHRPPLAHKLVYVATAASGNHVGGFCVWKTDQNVTNWAFFYDNIPIEYQSHQDTADHEMRGMLAAVRTWSSLWEDHHVVLRSHHPSIKGADHPTRRQLSHELEQLSEGHFSYELEWRLRKTDRVVDIAYCLAHLHRDFAHWYRTFQGHVDELLGPQNWRKVNKEKRTEVSKSAFLTEDNEDEDFEEDNMVKM
ncbi:unnamed protein product, partial [Meganyctiphanes norvegica]